MLAKPTDAWYVDIGILMSKLNGARWYNPACTWRLEPSTPLLSDAVAA